MTLFGLLFAPLEIAAFILFIIASGIGITCARHRAFGWSGGLLTTSVVLMGYRLAAEVHNS